MNIHASYFSIRNPFHILERWIHPYRHEARVKLRGNEVFVEWTKRAEQALLYRSTPLIVEMQLYFTCMVKKRVLFHEHVNYKSVPVNGALEIVFRPVEATSCDPVEFARNFPVKRELLSDSAVSMHPSRLQIDFQKGKWTGAFYI